MDQNIDVLARTCWGESRSEGYKGQQAVANVVVNRANIGTDHPHFGDGTIASACLAPWQFSCHNPNDPNLAKLQEVTDADSVFAQCLQIATDAVNGILEDITNGCTYYEVIGTDAPWSEGKTPECVIGKHAFYKDIA